MATGSDGGAPVVGDGGRWWRNKRRAGRRGRRLLAGPEDGHLAAEVAEGEGHLGQCRGEGVCLQGFDVGGGSGGDGVEVGGGGGGGDRGGETVGTHRTKAI